MRRSFVALALTGSTLVACGAVLDLEAYEIVEETDAGDSAPVTDAGPDTCWVPDGFGNGNPCFSCAASTEPELLNACTARPGYWFDDRARVPGPRPPLPTVIDETPLPASTPSTGKRLCRNEPNAVYVVGSSAMYATAIDGSTATALSRFGAALRKANLATLVYQKTLSCVGFATMIDSTPLSGDAVFFDADGVEQPCSFEDGKELADIGLSDVLGNLCDPAFTAPPPNIKRFDGPVQVFMFIAHKASTQDVISQEAAYRIYARAGALGPAPWTTPENLLKRNRWSGTQATIGEYIGLPAPLWQGRAINSGSEIPPLLPKLTPPDSTLAISSGDIVDGTENRSLFKLLAYQHGGQFLGFTPDTDRNRWDKRNVRDGHYALWELLHMYVRTGDMGVPPPRVQKTINLLQGVPPAEVVDFDYIGTLKRGGLVPRCAMRVDHDALGKLIPYRPDSSCHCAFENAVPSADNGCQSCEKAPCPAGTRCGPGKWCEAP